MQKVYTYVQIYKKYFCYKNKIYVKNVFDKMCGGREVHKNLKSTAHFDGIVPLWRCWSSCRLERATAAAVESRPRRCLVLVLSIGCGHHGGH